MKIFSTTVYGTNPRYIMGAHKQYELAKHFYPDWEFRVYVDNAKYFNMPNANIIEVHDGSYGMFWRLLPLLESNDNITIIRDADSRITEREALATHVWLLNDKKFHVMRDHEAHLQDKPIMGGIFGVKGQLSAYQKQVMQTYLHGEHRYGADEEFLRDHVYDESQCLIHEIRKGWFGLSRKLMLNRYEFCGNGYDEHDMPIYPPTMQEMNGYNHKTLPSSAKFMSYPT
jgi:hypothetical protein